MLKKWAFILGFTVLGLFACSLEGEASTFNKSEIINESNFPVFLEFQNGSESLKYIQVYPAGARLYFESNRIYVMTTNYKTYKSNLDGTYSLHGTGDTSSGFAYVMDYNSEFYKIIDTNTTVYNGATGNDVFFTAPNPFVMSQAVRVEDLPKAMAETMVGGGLISTGLMVLAILLGVFLVPRLIYSFLR